MRITSPTPGVFNAAGNGTKLTVTRVRSGVLKVVTFGADEMVLVDHVPFYVDCDVEVHPGGPELVRRFELTRTHVAYRFGSQQDRPSEEMFAAARTSIVSVVSAVCGSHGDEIGVVVPPRPDIARLIEERAVLARQLREAREGLQANEGRVRTLIDQGDRCRARIERLVTEIAQADRLIGDISGR